MTLLRWLTFLLGFLTVTLTVRLFSICFFLLMIVFVLQWLSLHWEILFESLSQFPLTFCQTQSEMHAQFHPVAYDNSCADWDGFCDHLRDVAGAASELCEWVQVGINVYVFHRKYPVKPHSSPYMLFSCLCCCNSS